MESQVEAGGLDRLFGPASEEGTVSLEAIRLRAAKQLARFYSQARASLDEAGILIPPAVGLLGCPQCSLTLHGSHPQEAELRAWLDTDQSVNRAFKEVEVLFEVVRTLEQQGQPIAADTCFHVGLTSTGPIAYFEQHRCDPA